LLKVTASALSALRQMLTYVLVTSYEFVKRLMSDVWYITLMFSTICQWLFRSVLLFCFGLTNH